MDGLVLDQNRPAEGAIPDRRLGAFNLAWSASTVLIGRLEQIEAELPPTRREHPPRRPRPHTDGGGEVAKIDWLEQGDVALLGILARLQAPGANAVQNGSRFDTSEKVDDVCCLSTDCSDSLDSMISCVRLIDQRRVRQSFFPTQCRRNPFGNQFD